MEKLGLGELRERYLKFFESKGHLRLDSFSLVPNNDPSLLLINSGMAPMKPYFSGEQKPPRKRVTTCQKCIRTPDIDNVGKTARHGTFFEMLGNFSFGDYFKEEAIKWGWEFVTEDLKMPLDRLYVSIYHEDQEAFKIWNEVIGLPADRIVPMGKEDNFWEHGLGPCGPCSEIYFDRGEEHGCGSPDCKVGCECDRFVEFWNLVFTEFSKEEDGTYSKLEQRNIDTGMGLERLACISQDVDNIFEVDTVQKILKEVCNISGKKYGVDSDNDVSIRVITDHIRSATFMISDGVMPSNEGRGYVLRRLIRRAARHGRLLGIENDFLSDLSEVVIEENKCAYSELEEKRAYIKKVIENEEERFNKTIDQGIGLLEEFFKSSKDKVIPGEVAFKLHDTYGFPIDLTREISQEKGMEVDMDGFKSEMEKQKNMAREALKEKGNDAWKENILGELDNISTEFVGYNESECDSSVAAIISEDTLVQRAEEGEKIGFIPLKTCFYAESGGQIADTGTAKTETAVLEVIGCKKTDDLKYIHQAVVKEGYIEVGQDINLKIDVDRRNDIKRNHSATHLLQKALQEVLGNHVNQAGSSVDNEKLRFDFTHFSAMTADEISKVEKKVNEVVLKGYEIDINEMPIDQAKKLGAMALFGEKYHDIVRVVKMGDYSIELCGGTHLDNTSKVGMFKIVSESGVAAGVRRIEAITGFEVYNHLIDSEALLNNISSSLKCGRKDIIKKIDSMESNIKALQKELASIKKDALNQSFDDIVNNAKEISGLKVVTMKLNDVSVEDMRNFADSIKDKIGSSVVIALASVNGEKVNFLVTCTKDAISKGVHSGNIVREIAKVAGGGGGGRPDMAQAGGKDISKTDDALSVLEDIVSKL